MVAYVLAGLVMGGIYAISASSMVVTYVSAGVLNFAFGSIAFFIARLYYYLNTESGLPLLPSAMLAIGVAGPLLGVTLYLGLFRFLSQSTPLTKVVATIGLSVAIPAVAQLLFGTSPVITTPGLAPRPLRTFEVLGVAITLDQLLCYACIVVVLAVGWYVLHRTSAGLLVRATVDSEALTSLSGVKPDRVAMGVWATGTFLAGLAGVLAGPTLNVDSVSNYTLLTASAFAAVVAARLTSLPIAIGVGLAMGVGGSLAQWWLPPESDWTYAVVSGIPFVIVVIALVGYSFSRSMTGTRRAGGILDAAIRVDHSAVAVSEQRVTRGTSWFAPGRLAGLASNNLFVIVALLLPILLSGYRIGLVGQGIAIAIVFLSYTLLTGQGGMISLCQITFAGMGALTTGQLVSVHGWPVLAGIGFGVVLAAIGGFAVGALTVRMGDLYVALATLTFGLLMTTLVFRRDRFYNFGAGVSVPRPSFLVDDHAFAYFMLGVFVLVGLLVAAIRYSTTGLALTAIRATETGARAVGINVLRTKIMVSTLAAGIAALGGGFLAVYSSAALPDSFDALVGLVWFAVLVTNGVRTNNAALAAGLMFVFLPNILQNYLSLDWSPLPTALFGLGAVLLARNPEGVISLNGQQLRALGQRIVRLLTRGGALRADDVSAQPSVKV